MRLSRVAVLLTVWGFSFPQGIPGQVEGTYRFVICEETCASTDTTGTLASGEMVLFPDSSFAAEIPPDVLASLRQKGFWFLLRNADFNACFVIPRSVRYVGEHEFFAGIDREALTRWQIVEGEFSIQLHRAPDGFFTLLGTADGKRIIGRGEQFHGGDPKPPDRHFLAERIGPPDPARCTGG